MSATAPRMGVKAALARSATVEAYPQYAVGRCGASPWAATSRKYTGYTAAIMVVANAEFPTS